MRESVKHAQKSLVDSAKEGNAGAFDLLCEKHRQQLLCVTIPITRNCEDAEDAVQDSMLRAFIHIKNFDGRSSFTTWLTRIAINSALMILRKKRNSREITVQDKLEFSADEMVREIRDHAPNPEHKYAKTQEVQIVRKAVHTLRPSLRKVVEIQQLQERSLRDTAAAMGISVAAAKARLFHARVQLRKSGVLKMMRPKRPSRGIQVLSVA
jgi:RNA polymerase sigma-70 factor (ECF subfamily)